MSIFFGFELYTIVIKKTWDEKIVCEITQSSKFLSKAWIIRAALLDKFEYWTTTMQIEN